jgi:ribonuclease J
MKQTSNREQRRKNEAAERILRRHRTTQGKVTTLEPGKLRIVPLGGQNGIGEKNMIVVEYENDAIVLDCGFELGLDLPGVNYAIPAVEYLQSINHKLRGYVISHGHMDHIGALVHVVPNCPAPIYGSRFTIGMVDAQFEKAQEKDMNYQQQTVVMDMDAHERLKLGVFTIELIRVTHSVPESSAIVVDTPVGRLINTGDFRLDPEPLDDRPSDINRLKQLGKEGVLLLMSESTNTTRPGRTPTEHTLEKSFDDIIGQAKGRVFAAVFSTNMNRVQMIINAAAKHGRKVALDGRSMMAVAELAVRLGTLKIPKNTLVAMRETASLPDNKLVVICTGGQGEPGAAMSRMSTGEHQYLKLKKSDTVIISSTPIPGNERSYQMVGDDLARIGVTQYRHPTHEIDGCGPLHVSGHAARDEHAEMIQLTRPKYLMPIYGGPLNREYHRHVGRAEGLQDDHIIMVDNGSIIEFQKRKAPVLRGKVTSGARLIDQNGELVPEMVIKDRFALERDGFVVVSLTIDRQSGRLLSSPDIITRGSFSIRDNAELMETLRIQLRRIVKAHKITKQTIELVKYRIKEEIEKHLADSKLSPTVIPIVTVVGGNRLTEGRNQRALKPAGILEKR